MMCRQLLLLLLLQINAQGAYPSSRTFFFQVDDSSSSSSGSSSSPNDGKSTLQEIDEWVTSLNRGRYYCVKDERDALSHQIKVMTERLMTLMREKKQVEGYLSEERRAAMTYFAQVY